MNELQTAIINSIVSLVQQTTNIEVVWLYGSRAKGNAASSSDYDLAVAFADATNSVNIAESNIAELKNSAAEQSAGVFEYPCEDLSYHWSEQVNATVSVIDINRAPVPLAYSVVNEGKVVFSNNALRLHSEEQRVWALWEAYVYEYNRT